MLSSGVINPLILLINPYLFVAVLALQFIALAIIIRDFNEKVWVVFLYSFLYYGVTVIFFKIYDLVIIFSLVAFAMFFRKTTVFSAFRSGYVWIFIAWLLFMLLHMIFYRQIPESKIEFVRHVMSFLVIILFSFRSLKGAAFDRYFTTIAITALFQVIMVYFITYYLDFREVMDRFLRVEIFAHETEQRGVGFFRDPAKYYVFLFTIIIIADELERIEKRKIVTPLLLIVAFTGSVLALSRAGIIGLAAYISVRFIRKALFRDQYKLFYQIAVCAIFLLIVNYSLFLRLGDYITYQVTAMTGRTGTLATEGKITEGNRMMVWSTTLEKVKERPLLGYGLGMNSAMTDPYYENSSIDLLPFPPHNTFLSLLFDIGIIGLGFYLIIFLPIFRKFYQEHILFLFILPLMILDMQGYRLYSVLFCIMALNLFSNPRAQDESLHTRTG